jgi:NitT/TauT family transport system permease protein
MMNHNIYQLKIKKEKRNILLIQIGLVIVFFSLWELLARIEILDKFLFSCPSEIIKLLIENIKSSEIFIHIGYSLLETLIALFIGTVLGIVLAIILWFFPSVSKILDPFLVVLNALPKTALAPILIVWAGTGVKGIVVVAISLSLVMTIISALNFFNSVDKEKIKMLKTFNANKFQILFKLVLPSNIPNLISIIKINIGLTWVGVIVGEFLVSRAGIGYLIMYGSQVFKMDLVMMGVIVLAIVAFVMYEIVNIIEKKFRKKRGIFYE